jgi:hypothetical protein
MPLHGRQYHQGRYKVVNPQKYVGDAENVIYRSSWELKFLKWCDQNSSVIQFGSEECIIPYIHPVDGRIHRYFVDFFIKVRTKSGEVKKFLVEIKPKKYTQPPKVPKRKTQNYLEEQIQYAVNQSKWKTAKAFCSKHSMEFIILTEDDLGIR